MQGGMTEETRQKFSMLNLVDPPMKPYSIPFPKEGLIYDYRFIKEVCTTKSKLATLNSETIIDIKIIEFWFN